MTQAATRPKKVSRKTRKTNMTDIMADARRWIAEQPQRIQTHGDTCHNWHVECLVGRLCAKIDALRVEVQSLKGEIRLQRTEIAGLREERAALLQADRPHIDRYMAHVPEITTDLQDTGQ